MCANVHDFTDPLMCKSRMLTSLLIPLNKCHADLWLCIQQKKSTRLTFFSSVPAAEHVMNNYCVFLYEKKTKLTHIFQFGS